MSEITSFCGSRARSARTSTARRAGPRLRSATRASSTTPRGSSRGSAASLVGVRGAGSILDVVRDGRSAPRAGRARRRALVAADADRFHGAVGDAVPLPELRVLDVLLLRVRSVVLVAGPAGAGAGLAGGCLLGEAVGDETPARRARELLRAGVCIALIDERLAIA